MIDMAFINIYSHVWLTLWLHYSLLQDLPGIPIFGENTCFKATVKARTHILNEERNT